MLLIIISISVWNNQDIIFAQQLKTQHISIGEGLSNGNVNAIIQDKYGFLWIATDDGLNRYDGYEFKVYKNVPGNPNSLIDNRVWDLKEDKDGNLWIATYEGVSYFARLTNKFTNYEIDTLVVPRDSGNPLAVSVLIDSFDDVWVGTVGAGALKLNKSSNKFQKVLLSDDQQINTALDITLAMTENENTIYTGNLSSGLIYYDRNKGEFNKVEFKGDGELPDFQNFNENITKLYPDKNGLIWIVSVYGVYKFNPATNEIFNIQTYKARDIFGLWMMYTGFITDTEGNIWIGKDKRGLFKYDGISDDFSQIEFGTEYPNMPNTYSEIIRTMYRDNTGIIWIGTLGNGLFKFDPASEPFTQYKVDPDNEFSIGGNELFSLYESTVKPNTIYVGLRGAGLNIFNPVNNRFSKVKLDFLNDVFGGSVRAILEENDGSLYLGTWGDGLFRYSAKSGAKLISRWDSLNNASLSNNLVRILKKDSDGLIWIGTANGLNVYDPVYGSVKRIYTPQNVRYNQEIIDLIREKNLKKDRLESLLLIGDNEEKSKLFSIDRPRDYLVVSVGEGQPTSPNMFDFGWIETESGDTIWTAAKSENSYYLNGALKNRITVELLRLKPGQYKLNYKSDDSHSYGKWNADAPLDSTLWGIQIFNLSAKDVIDAGRYISESNSQPLVSGTNIRSIHVSKQNNNIIWIGTDAFGLDKFDKSTNIVTNYQYDPKNKNTVSNNSIQFIHENDNGILWLATNAGLNRFDPVKEEFKVYTEEDGLPTNYIASILEDDMGKLWLATRNGLSRMSFSEDRATFVNYDSKDGLGGSDFIAQVALKGSNGKLYFGGEHGLNEFYPGKMNVAPPELIITDLKIGNKSVTLMGDDSPINTSIFDVKEITLLHDQNDLSFEFAALHYARAEKNQYAHILEGYDNDWSYVNRRFATYTNLDPGEYVFKFRGSNSDGIWNDQGKSIIIEYPASMVGDNLGLYWLRINICRNYFRN